MAAKTKEKETVVVKTQEEMYLDAERLLKATECLTRDKEKAEFFKNLADRYKDLGEYEDSKDKYEEFAAYLSFWVIIVYSIID